jgi:hypothetical protein
VPFPAVYALSSVVPPQPIAETRAEGTAYEVGRGPDGVLHATAPHHLSLTPAWSPIRVHALVLAAKLRGGAAARLGREGFPSLDPPFLPVLPEEPAPAMLLALRPVRIGWGREFFFEGEERLADPWEDAVRDQTIRAIDMKDYARVRALNSDSSNDPRVAALVAESLRLGGGMEGVAASLSYLSKKTLSSSSSISCNPWILFVRAMAAPPGNLSCIPEARREGFARSLDAARRQGWTLTSWVRALRTGEP